MRILAIMAIMLAGCMTPPWATSADGPPCEPEWVATWEDPTWYETTLDHPGIERHHAHIFDLGIADPALDPYEPFVTRNLEGPGGELYHDRIGYELRIVVPADEPLDSARLSLAPMLEALGLHEADVFEGLAQNQDVAHALQADGKLTILAYAYSTRVHPDVQGWWDGIGGLATANVTPRDDGAYLRWEGWALEIERVDHDIRQDGVLYSIRADGRVTARADEEIGRQAFLDAIADFAAQNNLTAADVAPHLTDCIIRE